MFLFLGGPELIDPAGMPLPQPAQSWVWLVDLERTIALLIGRCLGGMLLGSPVSPEEQDTAYWMKTPLFSDGVEMDTPQLGNGFSTVFKIHACVCISIGDISFSGFAD